MGYQITLDVEEVTKLVAHDLKESYDDLSGNPDESHNDKVMKAIEVVLQYYTKPSEYDEWFKNRGKDER
jgi:hypothetical protein